MSVSVSVSVSVATPAFLPTRFFLTLAIQMQFSTISLQIYYEYTKEEIVLGLIGLAEAIPFIELTDWDHRKLYALKGEVIRRGIQAVCNVEMPIFEKRRFQHGAIDQQRFAEFFPKNEADYRQEFLEAVMHMRFLAQRASTY